MATRNIEKVLYKIEANLIFQQEKLKSLRENMSYIEYLDYCDGDTWKPFTDEIAAYDDGKWSLDKLRLNIWYLVKTDTGIRLLDKEEYETYKGETHILYKGTYQACKDFIKV